MGLRSLLLVLAILAVGEAAHLKNNGKIVGGQIVAIDEVPYQISLLVKTQHICGGSVLSEDTILTAAHCVHGDDAAKFTIRAGSNSTGGGGQLVAVKEIHSHVNYDAFTMDFDVAILKLNCTLQFGGAVVPIELATSENLYQAGSIGRVTGWGTIHSQGPLSKTLLEVKVPIVDHTKCNEAYKLLNGITKHMFCAGLLGVGGKDSCQGDSGGPITVNGKLAGVVSWGIGCADSRYPGVYANAFALKEWIFQYLQ